MDFKPTLFNPAGDDGIVDEERGTVAHHAVDGSVYVYSQDVLLAVNLALATQRPLLVGGPPGSGKSTLAWSIAHVLKRRYYAKVVTSRTQAQDLEWSFDALRRLGDAQAGKDELRPRAAYLRPELLWWSFNPNQAALHGLPDGEPGLPDPALVGPGPAAVVLLDEIDKAEPDVPNDLLEPLDLRWFTVTELDEPLVVEALAETLIVITTNGERELPPAFIRRCVVLDLPAPNKDWLITIAYQRFGAANESLHRSVAAHVAQVQGDAVNRGVRAPSTAEFLDTLLACQELKLDTASDVWKQISQQLLWKTRDDSARKR